MTGLRRRDLLRLALGLGSGGAWPVAIAQPVVSAPLHRLHTGDLGALMAVDAQLGGQPWRCLVDSGASIALVSPALAQRHALKVIERTRVATAGGTIQMDRVALPAVEIAGQRVEAPQALVLDLARHLGDAGAAIDGLIGAPAWRDRVARFDLAAGRLSWGAGEPGGQAAVWPLRWDQGLPVIDLALSEREPAPFLFDTGNAGALVVFARHAAGLIGAGRPLPSVTLRELGGDLTVHHALLERLGAPGYVGRDVPVAFEAGATARRGGHFDRLAGSAGLALFGAGAVTLDGPGGRLIVEQPGLPAPPPLPGGFGFALQSSAGAMPRVSAVLAGGPAARAGLRPGARLSALNGTPTAGFTASQVWQSLAGAERAELAFDTLASSINLVRERFFPRWR